MKNARKLYKKDSDAGFTIVELIVIIVVIVILASIVIVSYTTVTRQSQMQTAKADAQTAASVINKYKAENGTYPSALSQVTVTKTQSAFNYVPNGATGYCVDATYKEQVANVKSGTVAAVEGACPTTGPVAPVTITNIALNPSAENDLNGVGFAWPWSGGVTTRSGGVAVSGGASFSTTTDSASGTQGASFSLTGAVSNKQYTCSMSFKGTDGVSIVFSGYLTYGTTPLTINSGLGPQTVALNSTSWTRKTIRFTTPANLSSARVQYRVSTAAAGVNIQADALMCVEGATDYNYSDGDSTGWSWVGARHGSASTGPSTGIAPAN